MTPPVWSIMLLSAVALAYEVLLTRLLSIIQWHHFSYMIISLALLGYGASGSFLSLAGRYLSEQAHTFFVTNAALFALSTVASFLLAQQLPFNALEMVWDARQGLYLLALYFLLAVPFFCVANCIGVAFMRYSRQIHRLYAVDLMGAGGGALGVILLLFIAPPAKALLILGGLGIVAAVVACWEFRLPWNRWVGLLLGAMCLVIFVPGSWTVLHPSEYKDLSQSMKVIGAESLAERSGPLGLVTVVRNEQVPFRYAPGMSLLATAGPPEQLGLFSDGNSLGVITRFTGRKDDLAYLAYLTAALPYQLLAKPHVLVLGAGGGTDVLQALYHRARLVDAVELNPQIVNLLRNDFADFAGGLYNHPDVRVYVSEARGFVAGSQDRYDLIQVALLDAFSTASAGLYALSESYLYTVEAFETYLRHLKPGGMLALTRWLQLPPRDSLKLFATAVAALERLGVSDPGARLLLIRSWKTSTLVIKNGRFNPTEIAALQAFCRSRSFDPVYYPGIAEAAANRFNVLDKPYFYQGVMAILGPARNGFFERYKFDITPATDDRPYFFHFLKLRVLPELLSLRTRGGLGQVEWGYIVLIATLAQALVAALVFILLPLWWGKKNVFAASGSDIRWRVLVYFVAIGLGFLFLEIAFIQKVVLFLSHPLYAVAVVLSAFLVFAGLGSGYSSHRDAKRGPPGSIVLGGAVGAIVILSLGYLLMLPAFFLWALPWPDPAKVVAIVLLIAPLAFCMGMPFPLVLARISELAPELIPWAWAINGCASVVSAVLATLLAIQMGFNGVIIIAAILYLGAAMVAPRPPTAGTA